MEAVDGIINDELNWCTSRKPATTPRFTTKSAWISLGLNGDLGGKNSVLTPSACGMFTFDPRRKILMYLQQRD
jgi:hypothetical protein